MRLMGLMDRIVCEFDNALRTLILPEQRITHRPSPAVHVADSVLSQHEKQHSAGLMRVNHSGEVCAQALYQGQAWTAQLNEMKQQMRDAAREEEDHLGWCEMRLFELESKPALLNPLWYGSSLLLGALAGLVGDRYSLGFVAETEQQVIRHLQDHLAKLPKNDVKTRLILEQMQEDEAHHAHNALQAGAVELPVGIKYVMGIMSKLMTNTSYYL